MSNLASTLTLTKRDLKILSFLAEQGVATAYQLQERYFRSPDSTRKRLSYLQQAGLLESVPISSGEMHVPTRLHKLKETLRSKGLQWQKVRLYRLRQKESERITDALSSEVFWQHQLGLNEIRSYLEKILYEGVMLTDPHIRSEWAKFKWGEEVPIPDLLYRSDMGEIAIEFERNFKGDRRYYERLLDYSRSRYHGIIFFCDTMQIFRDLIPIVDRFVGIGCAYGFTPEKVYESKRGFNSLQSYIHRSFNRTRIYER
jgi:predicted DNA-binding transcriptional regulator